MSSANRALKEKPLIGHLAVLAITLISVFTSFALNQGVAEDDLINSKADQDQVDNLELRINKTATVEYVDKIMEKHESNEEKMLKPIRDDIAMIKNYILYNKLPENKN